MREWIYFLLVCTAAASMDLSADMALGKKRGGEEAIPVIEIRGEGKPMTAAQIRHLEELSNGGPLDIKTETIWKSADCPRTAKRKDFISFHFKCFTEENKKVAQSYGAEPIKMQLGVGMASRGLDKGIVGMCAEELRMIRIPHRLVHRPKTKVWRHIPKDEHWIGMQVELLEIIPYSHAAQFAFLDVNNDTKITEDDLIKWAQKMRKEFGKTWRNEDVDNKLAAKYYIKYFDVNSDGAITLDEFTLIMDRDEMMMKSKTSKAKGRPRDPGFAWILDFNNDGIVTYEENDEAATLFEKSPTFLPHPRKEEL